MAKQRTVNVTGGQENFLDIISNFSPQPFGMNIVERKGQSHRMFNDEYSAFKSEQDVQQWPYQENSYLSRKIERQGQIDYYQRSSGALKRPVATSQEVDRGDFSQWKKTVYTNMTSRVLDGHRKQEDMKLSNWNSMMTKSERAANASSKSQMSNQRMHH